MLKWGVFPGRVPGPGWARWAGCAARARIPPRLLAVRNRRGKPRSGNARRARRWRGSSGLWAATEQRERTFLVRAKLL